MARSLRRTSTGSMHPIEGGCRGKAPRYPGRCTFGRLHGPAVRLNFSLRQAGWWLTGILWKRGKSAFDVTLELERRLWERRELHRVPPAYRLMTLRVIGAIRWEAPKLWRRELPQFPHPGKIQDEKHGVALARGGPGVAAAQKE